MSERTPRTISSGAGVGNPGGPSYPEQNPEFTQGGAPAGPFFSEGELPSIAVAGGNPANLGGYSPDPSRTPQVSIGQDPRSLGVTAPPSGVRR
jgi:hypothetical protein